MLKRWFRSQLRKRSRVYILPTRMGGYLNGLIFLMFLLAVGYGNNLLLIFTLFLFGFNLIWVVQTHFHLHGLKLMDVKISHGHAGEALTAEFKWRKAPQGLMGKLCLMTEDEEFKIQVIEETREGSMGDLTLPRRGLWKWKYLRIAIDAPFGFYYVWIHFPVDVQTFVYPALQKNVTALPLLLDMNDGEVVVDRAGSHDLRNLAPYQGEESKKISWKHYARVGQLFVREGEELKDALVRFSLKLPVDGKDHEPYLSELASQMVQCHHERIPFSFETPSMRREAALHNFHLHECLKELARC